MTKTRIVRSGDTYQVQYLFKFPFFRARWYPCFHWSGGPIADFDSLEDARKFVSAMTLRQGGGQVVEEYPE